MPPKHGTCLRMGARRGPRQRLGGSRRRGSRARSARYVHGRAAPLLMMETSHHSPPITCVIRLEALRTVPCKAVSPQDQHYLPQVYLRQWCTADGVLRYRYVGKPPRLEQRRKSPKSIMHEPDLYRLPENSEANSRTGNDLEEELGAKVDQRVQEIVARAGSVSGHVLDTTLADDLRWLMQTFVIRSPNTLAKQEAAAEESMKRNESLIDRMIERAPGEEAKAKFRQYKDARMPTVAARAALAVGIKEHLLRREGWLEGDLHVVPARDVRNALDAIGTGEFVTFEDPVVEWGESPGVVASFSLSPELLLVIVKRGTPMTAATYEDITTKHNIKPLAFRRALLCQTSATGELEAAAVTLMH